MTATTSPCEQETGLSLKELMMLPVILLWLTFQVFARHVVRLKEMRRTRPMPINWREHWPNLRLAEWHIRSLTSFGIKALLAGQELDLHELPIVLAPPEDHYAPMPQSALEMHRRFEATARFQAEPERYIRRTAERVISREGEIDPLGRAIHPPPPPSPPVVVVVVVVMVVVVFLPAAGFSAQPIRAPPWLGAGQKNPRRSTCWRRQQRSGPASESIPHAGPRCPFICRSFFRAHSRSSCNDRNGQSGYGRSLQG